MTNMTFETIVEKTKKMLGKNYRGDKEVVPVYSSLAPIDGHTDSFLVVSNGNFTSEEVALIKDKTRNYAWWVANKGYLVDDSQKEIPALFIYGSERGTVIPNVLNFNGATSNNFYLPIDRTDMTGNINNSSNHVYVQFLLNDELQEFETDRNGNNNGLIEINDITYKIYSGRLYPEDKKIVDNNIVYPIYLISNLEYYSISSSDDDSKTKITPTIEGPEIFELHSGVNILDAINEQYVAKYDDNIIDGTFDIVEMDAINETITIIFNPVNINSYNSVLKIIPTEYKLVTKPLLIDDKIELFDIKSKEVIALGGAHDAELQEKNNLEILEDVCEMVIHEAAQWTNRLVNERLLNECWPVIVKCSCVAYLNRGAEGLKSQSELGQQNAYNDWIVLMHQQITNRRYVL